MLKIMTKKKKEELIQELLDIRFMMAASDDDEINEAKRMLDYLIKKIKNGWKL